MEFDFQWLLIGLPLAFALGWVASRLDLRQLRRERSDAPRAYFKGLNLLLNEQQDKAIDAFIEAVQNDPDTTELHFALGNLFRRRGEFERAVRVHEHLLGRSDLRPGDRERAQRALAQDFMQAGLFDRAEQAWAALAGTSFDGEAQLALLSLFERSRDWSRAIEVAQRLERAGGASFAARVAHYECELAEQAEARQRAASGLEAEQAARAADAALQRAIAAAPDAARPRLLAGWRSRRQGDAAAAIERWDELRARQPTAFLLVAAEYARAALDADRAGAATQALEAAFAALPTVELAQALDLLDGGAPERRHARLMRLLRDRPSLSAAQLALTDPQWPGTPSARDALRDAVAQTARPLQRHRCAACGFEAQQYFWQCPGCLGWDTYPTQRIDAL